MRIIQMSTVTLTKKEYKQLKRRAEAYELIRQIIEEDLFLPPPVRSRQKIMSEFKRTGLYSKKSLKNLSHALPSCVIIKCNYAG